MTVARWTDSILFWRPPRIEEGKDISSLGWIACCFPRVMQELNSGKTPYVWVFTDLWTTAYGQTIWSGRRAVETWPIKGMPLWGIALWELLWEFEGCIKVGLCRCPPGEAPSKFRRWLESPGKYPCVLTWGGHVGPWNEWIWGQCSDAEMG